MVLANLAPRPQHGYGIARRIEQVSGDAILSIKHHLRVSCPPQQRGWIAANGARRQQSQSQVLFDYKSGRKQLSTDMSYWQRLTGVIGRVLAMQDEGETNDLLLPRIVLRIQSFARKKPLDRDLAEEMASHLQFAIEENIQDGMSHRKPSVRPHSFGGHNNRKKLIANPAVSPSRHASPRHSLHVRTLWRTAPSLPLPSILALGIGANMPSSASLIRSCLGHFPSLFKRTRVARFQSRPRGLSSLTYKIDVYDEYAKQNRSSNKYRYMPFFGSGGYSSPAKENSRAHRRHGGLKFLSNARVKPLYGRAFLPGEPPKAPPMSPFSITHSGASISIRTDRSQHGRHNK